MERLPYLLTVVLTILILMFFNGISQAQTSFNISNKTTGDTLLTIDNDGNVGIGTTTPGLSLDIRGENTDDGGLIGLSNSDGSHFLNFFSGRENDPNPFIRWTDGDPLRFATDEGFWSEKMRITSDGNVGIGTDSVFTKLHIEDEDLDLQRVDIGEEIVTIEDFDAGLGLYSNNDGNFGSFFNMGEIISSSLSNKWSMYRTTSNATRPNQLRFSFGSDAGYWLNPIYLALSNNGNIGIGTRDPSQRLHVDGTIYSSSGGFQFPDGSVQSSAVGGGGIAGNTLDQAYDQGGVGAGRTITADAGAVTVAGTDGFLATGTFGSGTIPIEGEGTRMMWYPGKAAFRAGRVYSGSMTSWDDENIGDYSFGTGLNTEASGDYSTAMGRFTHATGPSSTTMGYLTIANELYSTAMGSYTTASGHASTAMGHYTTASGLNSTAMGWNTTARLSACTAMGYLTQANGTYSTAMGYGTQAIGETSTATGRNTTASGLYSTAMGYLTTASGESSTSIGIETTASGIGSMAMGYRTTASGIYSTVAGSRIEAIGDYTFAIGLSDLIWYSVTQNNTMAIMGGKVGIGTTSPSAKLQVEGSEGVLFKGSSIGTIPEESAGTRLMWYPGKRAFRAGTVTGTHWDDVNIGNNSIATGYSTMASGEYSTALGHSTTASGNYSTAAGFNTNAGGAYSTTMGSYVSTTRSGSFMLGDYSTTSTLSNTIANNRFLARFDNGYFLYTSANLSTGVGISNGGSSWASISDSTKKENFKMVDGEDFLNKISEFKLTSWNYIGQNPAQFRHYGPMAQDFYVAFGYDGIGTIGNDTTIASADFDGVNLIAIQALEKRTSDLQKENKQLKEELAYLKSKMEKFESLFSKVEELTKPNNSQYARNKDNLK